MDELFWQTFGDGEVHTNEQRPMRGTMTTDKERLLDPSSLLGVYRFETKSPASSSEDRALSDSSIPPVVDRDGALPGAKASSVERRAYRPQEP
jgi:hypothetical protein